MKIVRSFRKSNNVTTFLRRRASSSTSLDIASKKSDISSLTSSKPQTVSSLTSTSTSSSLIEKLPKASQITNVPTFHPDYSPNLSFAQLQYLESGQYDVPVHDGNGNLLLKNGHFLPEFGKYGVSSFSQSEMFEWIKETEHLYRETYRDLMTVDPSLIPTDSDAHLLKFPFDKTEFFAATKLNTMDIKSWNLLLRVQAHQSHKNDIETTVDGKMKRKKAFLCVLSTFAELQSQSELAQQINIDTYNAVLYAMSSHSEPTMCIDLLREMGNFGFNPSQQSYLFLIRAHVKKGQVHEARDILNYICANCDFYNVELFNEVIFGYLSMNRKEHALALFDRMMQIEGIHPNVKSYTIMMEYYRQSKNVNGAIELLRECEERGFLPNLLTYNAVILAAAYGDVEDASLKKMFEIFDEMVITKEIPPNDESFGALIVGCGNFCDIELATQCLHLMDKMGIKRTAIIYESYLKAIANTVRKRNNFIRIGATKCLKTNDLIRLSEGLLKQMDENEIDIKVVNALLSVYAYSQTINRCMMFLKTLPIRFPQVEANKETLDLVWNACLKSRRYKEAKFIFNLYEAKQQKTDMFRCLVRLASYWKDAEGVAEYLSMMKERGLTIRGRDKAYLAMVSGTKAEQLEARRRFNEESIRRRKDVQIREKAGKHGKKELSFRYWKEDKRKAAEKAAGIRLKQPPRNVGKVYWNVDRTLGQLDDPW